MNKLWSTITLILMGLLLSCSAFTESTITLTERNHVLFSGEVTDESVAQAQIKLARISARMQHSGTIFLVIDSPGGSVPAGNRLIDFANSLPQTIKPLCLFCASMGYHMFQSFGERLVFASSVLMSHRVSIGGLSGQVPGEAVTRLNEIIATSNRMDEVVDKRVGITTAAYQSLIYNELWLSGYDAVATKHADKIAKVRCDEALAAGTRQEKVNTMFGPVDVTYSTCPLISGFLELKPGAESKFRSWGEAADVVRKAKRSVRIQY